MVKRATEMEFFFSFCNINYNVKEKKREREKTNKFLVYKWMSIWKGKSKSKVIRECVCVRERMQLACRMWPCYSVCDVIVHQSVPVEIVWRYVPRKESEKTKYKYKISKINVRYSYVFFIIRRVVIHSKSILVQVVNVKIGENTIRREKEAVSIVSSELGALMLMAFDGSVRK